MAPCCAETSLNVGLEGQGRSSGEAATYSGSICHIKSKDHGHSPRHYLEYSEGSSCDGLHHHGYVPTHSCHEKSHSHTGRRRCSIIPRHVFTSFTPRTSSCSSTVCCVRKISAQGHEADSTNLDATQPGEEKSSVTIQISNLSPQAERIVLKVQGMTCTGCESNLHRVLSSIAAVSRIKTSLLISQAEFDLKSSMIYNGGNIAEIIEQMTGFPCTRITHAGEDLDLILPAGMSTLEGPWPQGLVGLVYLGRERVRISYLPEVVGARTLLSHPFFRSSQFAPTPQSPAVAFGRAGAYESFLMTALSTLLTIPVLVLAYANLPDQKVLYGSISLFLATIVQLVVARSFYTKAYKSLRYSGVIEMDMLVVLSTTAAYVYSVVAFGFLASGDPLSTGEFFETSTLLVTLIMVGRTAAAYARQRAIESISMESLQVQTAIIVDSKDPEVEELIDSRLLQYGDTFKVLPDTRVVTDGMILEGETEVDESLLTGEATLLCKKPRMSVIAGSINHSGTLLVELTRLPSKNTIKRITAMVDEAKLSKAKVQEIADHVAGHFTQAIIGITTIVFIAWIIVGKTVRHQNTSTACINAMTFAISTLIVSCPCAIGFAVPMVQIIAGSVGARYGLVFKSAETIEIGRKISHVVFDKTGTLTQGNPSVVDAMYLSKSELLPCMILGLTRNNKHPVSSGIDRYLSEQAVEPVHVEHVVSVSGKGIEGTFNGTQLRAGNPTWLGVEDLPAVQMLLQRNLSTFCVEINGTIAAVFGLQDKLRPDAIETIEELKRRSISISLISGDNDKVVNAIGTQLGIPEENTRSCCTPAQKQAYVKDQLAIPKSTVLFCGDGTNDAVALSQASIGLHMNGGTDVAQSAADTILINSSLKRIITLIDLSRAFYRRVVFNFVWSFVYNLFAILLAAGAFPKARIPPAYAGLGELVSVLPVIAIAMQLRWMKF